MRELAELRASVKGNDAASRRLLTDIGRDANASALLVVTREGIESPPPPASTDAGLDTDGGTNAALGAGAVPPMGARVVARLFDVKTGEFDAARYEPEAGSATPWQATVQSLVPRFPAPPAARPMASPPPPPPLGEGKERKPFYLSPWFWGAVGGALLVGAFVYFAGQKNDGGDIHLQMHVPH
jgi:hypothetical protein